MQKVHFFKFQGFFNRVTRKRGQKPTHFWEKSMIVWPKLGIG
jgi:hypothetical protein